MYLAKTKREYEAKSQIEGADDGYTTLSGVVEDFSDAVDMVKYEAAIVQVEIDYDGTPTDEVDISLYSSLDGVSFDNTPIWTIRGDKSIDPQRLSFVIEDLPYWRLGFVQTGSTDSHNVRAYIRLWGFSRESIWDSLEEFSD